jgi:8-oxo-dGTP diphosphatase
MHTVREISAGGVVYRKRSGDFEIALIRVGRRWGLPKGHVEEGEKVLETAIREVLEETGLESRVIERLGDITYWYSNRTNEGEPVRIFKRVYFFLLRWLRGDVLDHDQEVDEARWFSIDEAIQKLSYATERKMVRKALTILSVHQRRSIPQAPAGQAGKNR